MNQDVYGAGDGRGNEPLPVEQLGYEEARDELVETVKLLELGQMGLDESLALWERGEALARRCEEHLAGARAKVEAALSRGANGAGGNGPGGNGTGGNGGGDGTPGNGTAGNGDGTEG